MGKNIKVTGTRVGSDGSGYFRGNDGKYYYGNPQNGYLRETTQSRQAHSQPTSSDYSRSSGYGGGYSGGADTGIGIIDGLFLIVESAVLATVLIAMFFIGLVSSIVLAWPQYISMLAGYYQRGQADLMVIIMSVVVAFLIGYFIYCAYKVFATKRMQSRHYILVCIIAMVVPAIPVGLFLGQPSMIPSFALDGIIMSMLPAFVLCWLEHLATKELRGDKEWFLSKIARLITRVFPFHALGMIVFGVLTLLGGAQFTLLINASGAPPLDIVAVPLDIALEFTGILFIIMGIIAKKKGLK